MATQSAPLAGAGTAHLVRTGFTAAGTWSRSDSGIRFDPLGDYGDLAPALYAFVVDGQLAYIGKTAVPLRQRLGGYRPPARNVRSGASTNRHNHRRIREALSEGQRVDIWVLAERPDLRHGDFVLDVPAALERAMIEALAPP